MKLFAFIFVLTLPATVFASGADLKMTTQKCSITKSHTRNGIYGFNAQTESKWACYRNDNLLHCNVVMGQNLYSNDFTITTDNSVILVARDANNSTLAIDRKSKVFMITGNYEVDSGLGVFIENAVCFGTALKYENEP